MSFAKVQTDSRELNQVQSNVATALTPLLTNPYLNGNILTNVALINGTTLVPHGLGRTQQGWTLVDTQGAAQIYRSGNFNSTVLSLTSDAGVTVSLYVF